MEILKKLNELICQDCGAKFFGVVGKYCEVCRKRRRQKRDMQVRVCPSCGLEKKMFPAQEICTDCAHAQMQSDDNEPRTVYFVEQRRKARQTGGKLTKIERCPRFDGGNITCVTCEPGSWKFKDCGKVILAIVLLAGLAQGYTIKATGYVRAVIVEAPGAYEQTIEENKTVVYTEVGPTLQVVF